MFRDFLVYCGINLVEFLAYETRYTPRILLSLLERFPEGNEYSAEVMGHRDFRDWSLDRYLLAGVINAVNMNTAITGGPWKNNKAPEFPSISGPMDEHGKPRLAIGQKATADKSRSLPSPHTPGAPGNSSRLLEIMGRFAE